MGAVYKARQMELDRMVAVKILPPEVSTDPAFAERFTREARALARLSHPNIVAVYDFGRTGDGLFYFIMEYVDGVNLRQAIQSGGMDPKQALAIVPQICDALQFAHDEGVVHRDIKPENILIDKRGRVKIADFGLAKLLGQESVDHGLTATQQVMGTLRYMAPEQMEGSKSVDHRADIYSLGVVFYELLTGELPIGRFAPPSKMVEIDVRLDEVVLRALENKPEKRYQHASEVKTEVELIRGTSRASTPLAAPLVESSPVRCSPWRRARLLATLTVWTGILFGGWGYFFPLVWHEWWPWGFHEHWEASVNPQSRAYERVNLRAERKIYCWGSHVDRPIFKRPWIGTATIDVPGHDAAVTLEMDSFLEEWRWTLRDGTATHSPHEPPPEFVVQWMKAAGIDFSKPGVQEEAAALIGLVKDAAQGVLLGVPSRGNLPSRGTKIGPFIFSGTCTWGIGPEEGAVGPVDTHLLAGVLLLVIWLPGILIIVRRHRRRLATAHETEQRYRLGTIGFWVAILCFLAAVATSGFPWVRLSPSSAFSMFSRELMAFSAWYGTVSVLAFLVVLLLCFLTDFFDARRSWQPRAMIAAGAIVVIVTGILFWRLSGPATLRVATIDFYGSPQMVALVSTVGCWQEYELFHGSFTENAIPKTLDQRSGPGLQLAMALGLVLLMVGCFANWRARRRAAEPTGAVEEPHDTRSVESASSGIPARSSSSIS